MTQAILPCCDMFFSGPMLIPVMIFLSSCSSSSRNIPYQDTFPLYLVVPVFHCSDFSARSLGGFWTSRVVFSSTVECHNRITRMILVHVHSRIFACPSSLLPILPFSFHCFVLVLFFKLLPVPFNFVRTVQLPLLLVSSLLTLF